MRKQRERENARFNWISVSSCAVAFLAASIACPAAADDAATSMTRLAPPPLEIGVVTFPNGRAVNLSGGIGGGAYADPRDPPGRLVAVSDRGPALFCAEAQARIALGPEDMCGGDPSAEIHPLPDYNPVITLLSADDGGTKIEAVIPITDRAGRPVTGLPNPLSAGATARAYGAEGQILGLNPAGLDPRAILRLDDGRFLIGDANAASLVLVSAKGMVERRLAPLGLENDLRGADYEIEPALPGYLAGRRIGDGFAGLGLSADGALVYAAFSNALPGLAGETHVPVFYLDKALKGVVGGAIYPLEPGDGARRLSEIAPLGKDRFVAVETGADGVDLFEIVFPAPAGGPKNDEAGALSRWPVLIKRRVGSLSGSQWAGRKLDAAAMLPGRRLLIIADRDYGFGGRKTTILEMDLSRSLPE
jgi:hypothetical protein